MENLSFILEALLASFEELDSILIEEVSQLNRLQINPISLQAAADTKSCLLSTIKHYDELRKQKEISLNFFAPYSNQKKLELLWSNVIKSVKSSKTLNLKIYNLLDIHMQKNNSIKNLVTKAGVSSSLYCSDGRSDNTLSGRVYNISV